jgi:Cu(I)/Ag(I) efflux system membrane protein CusA/SilA
MKSLYLLALALPIAFASTAQAQMSKDAMSSMKMPGTSQKSVAWTDAVVQKIDPDKQMIVLKHSDILNLAMPAMTMGFDVANKKLLDVAKPGDRVRFQVELMNGTPTVTHLEAAR